MKPKIYKIVDIDQEKPIPVNTAVIIENIEKDEIQCDKCGNEKWEIKNYLIEGFDEFDDLKNGIKGFLGFDTNPLVASRYDTEEIAKKLLGCNSVNVGYLDWNQEDNIPKSEQFTKEPLLGALSIYGVCNKVSYEDNSILKRCDECGSMCFYENNEAEEEKLLLHYDSWDKTEIFNLDLYFNTITVITKDGRQKLDDLGFDNLIYEEIFWADSPSTSP